MALPILKNNINEVTLICLSLGKSIDEKQKFSWSHPVKWQCFYGLQPQQILLFWRHIFLIISFWKTQQRYFDLNMNNKFLKNLSLMYFTWNLILLIFFDHVSDIVYRMIKWVLNRLSKDVLCDILWWIKELPFYKNEKTISAQSRAFAKTYEYLQKLDK